MNERRCIFQDCIEPATQVLPLTWGTVTRTFDVCRDHFHDIDWEVIPLDHVLAEVRDLGLLDPLAPPSDDDGERRGIRLPGDPGRSSADQSA